MTWPQPTRQAHELFCRIERWDRVRDARGRTGTHHLTFELALPDGRILRTRISHPVDRTTYGPSIWTHILRDQLDVVAPEFWRCVQAGTRPERGSPAVPAGSLPAELVHLLITRVGLSGADVATLTRNDAVARLNQYWTSGA